MLKCECRDNKSVDFHEHIGFIHENMNIVCDSATTFPIQLLFSQKGLSYGSEILHGGLTYKINKI